jgi:DNA-binding NarL/FixJ family response regulator
LFNRASGFRCVFAGRCSTTTSNALVKSGCRVALVAVGSAKDRRGIDWISMLSRKRPELSVLALIPREHRKAAPAILAAGAAGCLLNDSAKDALLSAVQALVEIRAHSRTRLARYAAQNSELRAAEHNELGKLTRREREVLELVARGRTNKDIAQQLHISRHTVGNHIRNIYGKVGVKNRAEATAKCLERPSPLSLSKEA